MLYSLLKPIITLALRAYFKRIDIINTHNLEHESVLFVCNHPSALFDPVLVAATSKKPLFFLAGAEWFGKGLQKWFFQNQFNMIPVYRPWLRKGAEKKEVSNDDMFKACYESLGAGKRIIIFPEASSITVPWIREIKTGAARIKLGADKTMEGSVKIVPIGLNYTNPHRFQTGVLINVGDPIAFEDLYIQHSEDEKELVRAMTDRIKEKMGDLLYFPDDEDQLEFIKDAKKLLTGVVRNDLSMDAKDVETEFNIRKAIANGVQRLAVSDSEGASSLASRLREHISEFENMGFRQYNPFQEAPVHFVTKIFGLVLGFPLFVIGTIYNLLPYLLTRWIYVSRFASKVSTVDAQGQLNTAFAGSLGFVVGLVLYLIWYIALLILASRVMPIWAALGMTAGLGYFSGQFAMNYYKWFVQMRKYLRWKRLVRSNKKGIESLLLNRQSIIDDMLSLRIEAIKQG